MDFSTAALAFCTLSSFSLRIRGCPNILVWNRLQFRGGAGQNLMKKFYSIFAVMVLLLPGLFACNTASTLSPTVTSEDFDLDQGGNDISPAPAIDLGGDGEGDLCGNGLRQRLEVGVAGVEIGHFLQVGANGRENPGILEIGLVQGGNEPLTRLHLEFITDKPTLIIGNRPENQPPFFRLFDFRTNQTHDFSTVRIENERVKEKEGLFNGNRIAIWADAQGVFDGGLDLDVTYGLQVCSTQLFDLDLQTDVWVASQPLFVKVRVLSPF